MSQGVDIVLCMHTRLLALLGVIMMALSFMPGTASADDIDDMSNHVTTYEIHTDGSVSVKSTATWRFKAPLESLYFTVPMGVAGENELSGVRIVAPNGQEPKTQMDEETGPEGKRVRRYTIHAKDFPIESGPWTVEYTLSNLLGEYQDWTVFTWRNFSPDNPPIRRWEATITTPWQIDQTYCTVNGKETCRTAQEGTSVTFSGGEIPTGTDVVIQAAIPTALTGHIGKPEQPGSSSSAEASQSPSESSPSQSPSSASASASEDTSSSESTTPATEESTDNSDDEKPGLALPTLLLWAGCVLVLVGIVALIMWLVRHRKPDDNLQHQEWPEQPYPPQQYPQQGPGQPYPPSQGPGQPYPQQPPSQGAGQSPQGPSGR